MPRISEATVVEHRRKKERAVLDAARRLVVEEHSLTLTAVAREAGLARTSLYQYVSSLDDLVAMLVDDVFPRWSERVVAAMDAHDDAGSRVRAYVAANLELVAEGEHAVLRALSGLAPPALTEASHRLYAQLREPLEDALNGDEIAAELVQAVVRSGSQMIEDGRAAEEVKAVAELVLGPFCDRLGAT